MIFSEKFTCPIFLPVDFDFKIISHQFLVPLEIHAYECAFKSTSFSQYESGASP